MQIKILGTGCPSCQKLEANVKQVVAELKLETEVEKITDISEIMSYAVMSMPALVIDEEVKIAGRVPDCEELKQLFSAS